MILTRRFIFALVFIGTFSNGMARAQEAASGSMPRIVKSGGHHALMVDDAPFLMLGAQVHNSSAWPAMMPKVWPAIELLHANTVEIPIYWEQFEPQQGTFDYSNIDMLLDQAREHKVHLVLLWFGTWKNGSSHYMPQWMRRFPEKYPNILGKNGKEVDSPSPYCQPALEADISAFTRLMEHLKSADSQHTVLMVQVENEPGTWGSIRDYSPVAQKLYEGPVPAELLKSLHKQSKENASWHDVFGEDAEEFFHAYSIAHYIQQVAAAGKAVYPLPLYVNVSLRDPLNPGHPPSYESGAATDNVIPLWKAAAPAIDLIAPDIYKSDTARVLKWMELYHREDNPLFIPEIGSSADYARYCYAAIGNQAIGYSPFGMDYSVIHDSPPPTTQPVQTGPSFDEMALNYRVLEPMAREIAKLNFEGKVQAAVEREDKTPIVNHFGAWDMTTTFGVPRFGGGGASNRPAGNPRPIGRALFAQLSDNEFIVTGFYCRVAFAPAGDSAGKPWQYLRVEEGQYSNGTFKPTRIWNGDETDWGLNFRAEPAVLHVTVMTR